MKNKVINILCIEDHKLDEVINFLNGNKFVTKVNRVNDMNEVFCTLFNLWVETSFENDREYAAFHNGIREIFKPLRFHSFEILERVDDKIMDGCWAIPFV